MSKSFKSELSQVIDKHTTAVVAEGKTGYTREDVIADILSLLRTYRPEKMEHKYEDEAEALYDWEAIGWNRYFDEVSKAYGLEEPK